MQEVIAHRGKTDRNPSARPATTTSRASRNRRQDGNYNGGFPKYTGHMAAVREQMEEHFTFG